MLHITYIYMYIYIYICIYIYVYIYLRIIGTFDFLALGHQVFSRGCRP